MDSVLVSYNVFPVHFCLVLSISIDIVQCVYLTNNSLTEMRGQTSLSCVTDGIRRGYRGDRGSECLGLASGPRLSLVRLGDRLVRALASSTGVVDRGSSGNRGLRIDSCALIGDLSYVAIGVIGVVVDMLDPAVRKSHRVRTLGIASSVTGLGSIEVRVEVVVSDGVVVCVGGDLVRVGFDSSVSYNRSVVGRGSVDYRSSVNHRGSVNHGSMGNGVSSNKSMSYKSVSCDNTMTGSMESIRRVMHGSYGGSEGLRLCVCSVFSLERLGDGLVRDLAGTTVSDTSSKELSRGGCYQAGNADEYTQ